MGVFPWDNGKREFEENRDHYSNVLQPVVVIGVIPVFGGGMIYFHEAKDFVSALWILC